MTSTGSRFFWSRIANEGVCQKHDWRGATVAFSGDGIALWLAPAGLNLDIGTTSSLAPNLLGSGAMKRLVCQ
jgi:hypothetical protein